MYSFLWHMLIATALGALFQGTPSSAQLIDIEATPSGFSTQVAEPERQRPATPTIRPGDLPFNPTRITESAEVTPHGALFQLTIGDKKFGPYLLDEGALVGPSAHQYAVTLVEGGTFSLKAQALYGPFDFRDGEQVTIGESSFTLTTLPHVIFGRVEHPRLLSKRVPIRVLLLTPTSARDLMAVRQSFAQIAHDRDAKTKPVRYRAPTVSGPPGLNRTPIVNRSERDIDRTNRSASRRAHSLLEAFLSRHRARVLYPGDGMRFSFRAGQPGVYLVCALAAVSPNVRTPAIQSEPIIWCAHVRLLEGSAEVFLGPDDVLDWDTLFLEP